jgi:hypothetical protein
MKAVLISLISLVVSIAYASNSGVTYQGRILKPDGSPLSGQFTQFKMQLRTPDSGSCLMYEEVQSQDLRNANGVFSLTMNDGTGSRTDSTGLTLDRIFANRGTFNLNPASCNAGSGVFAPGQNDGRDLVVLFKDETMASWEPIPSQKINFVPLAFESKQVQGFTADSLLRVVNGSGDPLTGLAPLSNAQYTELMALVNGTSTAFTKSGQLGGVALPTMSTGEVLGWNGSAWVSQPAVAGANSVSTTMIQNNAVDSSKIASGAVGTSQVAGNVTINTSGTLGAAITTTRDFKIFAASPSAFFIDMQAPALAASYSLVWPMNAGSNGQVLTTDGTGILTWAAAGTPSQWTTQAPGINYMGGNVGIGTTSPLGVLEVKAPATAASANGSSIGFSTGAGGSSSGNGGALNVTTGGASTGNGGAVNFVTGSVSPSGNGGAFSVTTGSVVGTGYGGNISMATGTGSGGGNFTITTGNGSQVGNVGGAFSVTTGNGTGFGGNISLTAGTGGTAGGNVKLTAGAPAGVIQLMGGNVGIGTTVPNVPLQVNGWQPIHTGATIASFTNSSGSPLNILDENYGTGYGPTLFANGASLGLALMATGPVRVVAGGSAAANEVARFTGAGVGIGTTAPTAKLQLAAGSAAAGTAPLKFTSGPLVSTPEDGAMEYNSGSGLWFTIGPTRYVIPTNTAAGNYSNVTNISNSGGSITMAPAAGNSVIINQTTVSTSPITGALIVNGGAGIAGALNTSGNITSGGSITATTNGVIPQLYGSTAASGNIKIDGTSNATPGNVYLASAGANVGIGTTVPGSKFHIMNGASGGTTGSGTFTVESSGSTFLQVLSGAGAVSQLRFGDSVASNKGVITYSHASDVMGFYTASNGVPRVVIDGSGNVGIGTSSPSTALHVISQAAAMASGTNVLTVTGNNVATVGSGPAILLTDQYWNQVGRIHSTWEAGGKTGLALGGNGPESLYVANSGYVGIGTTSPGTMLDVGGGIRAGNTAQVNVTCNAANEGVQRYNTSTHFMEFCNGTNWMQPVVQAVGSTAGVFASGPPVSANAYTFSTASLNYAPVTGSAAATYDGSWRANGADPAPCLDQPNDATSRITFDLGSSKSVGNIYFNAESGYPIQYQVSFSTDNITYSNSTIISLGAGGFTALYQASVVNPIQTARYLRVEGITANAKLCQFAVGP